MVAGKPLLRALHVHHLANHKTYQRPAQRYQLHICQRRQPSRGILKISPASTPAFRKVAGGRLEFAMLREPDTTEGHHSRHLLRF
jgi:hypothetical protein